MMSSSTSYENMNWVMKHYEKIDFVPKKGNIYFSDYAINEFFKYFFEKIIQW